MKKLMAMLGAVAMSFGLFADATPFAISFESAEQNAGGYGVDVSTMKFTPPTEGWAWDGDPLTLKEYADGEELPYGTGAKARRNNFFEDQGLVDNVNYLDLETGDKELTRDVGAGNLFLDQLVKFTGFEEIQTNLVDGTKIAVWMSGFENDDTVVGETNLYVTVGQVDIGGNVKQVALKVKEDCDLDAWYRLTIKTIGNIFGESTAVPARAGFIIYINGEQVASSDDVAKSLIAAEGYMTEEAKGFMAQGQLFPSIAAGATFTSVGFKGIGAIDDVILDAEGPEFAQKIGFTVVPPLGSGIEVDTVVTADGETLTEPYKVKAGTYVTITYKAAEGYKLMGEKVQNEQITTADQEVKPREDITAELVVATIIRDVEEVPTVVGEYAQSELTAALATEVQDGDTIVFVADCTALEDAYKFQAGTTIGVTEGGNWDVKVPGEGAELTDTFGAMPEKRITVTFTEDPEWSTFNLAGTIYGNGRVDTLIDVAGYTLLNGNLTIGATHEAEEGAGAILESDYIGGWKGDEEWGTEYTIKLVGTKANVVTTTEIAEDAFVLDDGYVLNIATNDIEGTDWFTYTQVAPAADPVCEIDGVKYNSLAEAFGAAEDGQTITVIANCSIDERINVSAAGRSIKLDATDYTVTCNCIYPIVWGDYTEDNAGTLTVAGGTFQQDTEPDGEWSAMILWTKNGKIEITGGTFNVTKGEGQIAYVGGAQAVNGSIEVTGGTFRMCDKASGAKGDVFNVQNSLPVTQIQVKGGSFSKDLSEGDDHIGPTFVAKGYTSVANASTGLWDVVPMVKPTVKFKDITEDDPDYAKCFRFDFEDGNPGVGYDDWIATYKVVSDVDIGADELAFYGHSNATGYNLYFDGCEAGVATNLNAYQGSVTINRLYNELRNLRLGIFNRKLKTDAKIKIDLVITSPDGKETETLYEIPQFDIAAKEFKITYMNGDKAILGLEPSNYTAKAAAALPTADEVKLLGIEFLAWYDNADFTGDPVTVIPAGSTGDKTFYAKVEEVVPVPLDDDEPLSEKGKAAYEAILPVFGTPAEIKTWADAVYADGKIPASKLNGSTPDLIAIAKVYNIPVLTEQATVTTAQAADGAFTFKIVDGGDVQLLAAKVEKMIKYSADLGTFAINADQVGATVQEDNVTIKAVFKKPNNEAKGFMKLELTAPDAE